MSAVSETIVREYFELHGFLVRQQRKFLAPTRAEDEEIDFLIHNPGAAPRATPLPSVLASADLPGVARAVVVVKGWHTEIFSSAVLENAPEIFRFADPAVLKQTVRALGGEGAITKILVVPALPQSPAARDLSLDLLRRKGIDCVIPFRTLLADLVGEVEVNRNYQKSDLLQTLRILKNYGFLREPQLELFKSRRPRAVPPARKRPDSPPPAAGG